MPIGRSIQLGQTSGVAQIYTDGNNIFYQNGGSGGAQYFDSAGSAGTYFRDYASALPTFGSSTSQTQVYSSYFVIGSQYAPDNGTQGASIYITGPPAANTQGGDFNIYGAPSTGTALNHDMAFFTGKTTGVSGTGIATLTEALRIKGETQAIQIGGHADTGLARIAANVLGITQGGTSPIGWQQWGGQARVTSDFSVTSSVALVMSPAPVNVAAGRLTP
jgi:hypothetical protein